MKKTMTVVLAVIMVFMSATALAVPSLSTSQTSDPGVFRDMVPYGQKVGFFEANLLPAFDNMSILDIISENGLAALVVTSMLDYSSAVADTNWDGSKTCYVGISLSRYAMVFCEPGGEYLCVMYSPHDGKAAYYNMGTSYSFEASTILRNAMPNHDCREVSKSAMEFVVDRLYSALIG